MGWTVVKLLPGWRSTPSPQYSVEGIGGVERKEMEGTEAPQMRMAEGRRGAGGKFMSDCEGPSVFPVVLLMAWC